MPPPKHKQKGKGKGKSKGKQGKSKQHGHGTKHKKAPSHQGGKKETKKQQQDHSTLKKSHINEKQSQQLLQTKMIDRIGAMYTQRTNKHESMRTFCGIFTRHNQLQLRELMKTSIPHINDGLSDKFLKSTQHDDNRDLNQFIYLGDVVIGAYASELLNNNKDCLVKAFCILPHFRNFGFGSRLLVHLIKNAVKRKKLNTISLFIDEESKKGIAFFECFGFKIMKQHSEQTQHQNGMKKSKNKNKKEEKKQEETDVDCKNSKCKMRLDLRIYRSSIMVLVKKELKEQSNKNSDAT